MDVGHIETALRPVSSSSAGGGTGGKVSELHLVENRVFLPHAHLLDGDSIGMSLNLSGEKL